MTDFYVSQIEADLDGLIQYARSIDLFGLKGRPDDLRTVQLDGIFLSASDVDLIFSYIRGRNWRLKSLELTNNSLKTFPDQICNLEDLTSLQVRQNEIGSLPESIGTLINLKYVSFFGNRLIDLPSTFGNLISLEIVGLGKNRLTSIPESIRNLKKLEVLSLNRNRLTGLPTWLGELKKLKIFSFSDNQVQSFPLVLYDLVCLTDLDFRNNQMIIESANLIRNFPDLRLLWFMEGNRAIFDYSDLLKINRMNIYLQFLDSEQISDVTKDRRKTYRRIDIR